MKPFRFLLQLSTPVKISLLLQLAGLAGLSLLGLENSWPWVVAWLLLNHSILAIAGTIPRSTLLGPNQTELTPAAATNSIALTFDDGPDPEVTPQVLELLEARSVKATFFVIGKKAVEYADLVTRIHQAGHAVENHTQSHSSWFCTFLPGRLRRELVAAQESIFRCGVPLPVRFRAPAGVRSPWLQPVLVELGLHLTSWSRRGFDTSQTDPGKVLSRLTRGLRGGEILLLHDGNAARTVGGKPMVLEVLPALLDEIQRLELQPVLIEPHP